MENSLKQRIIGAVVLAALAIIFLPAILKEKASNGTFESKIPEKPKVLEEYRVDTNKIEKLNRGEKEKSQPIRSEQVNTESQQAKQDGETDSIEAFADDVGSARKSKFKPKTKSSSNLGPETNKKSTKLLADKLTQTQSADAPPEVLSPQFKSAAWVIQVASFSNESNAVKLIGKLKKSQFKAYRRTVVADGKTVYRVYVGPYIEKAKAQKAAVAVSKASETEVVLRIFDPLKL